MVTAVLTIVIVSFNTENYLRNCLKSIYSSCSNTVLEVIVVDNNSGDSSVEMCRAEFPGVVLIENSKNNMFAKANNQGINISKGEYVLLLNSDTVVPPTALDSMYEFISSRPQVAAVGPRLLNEDGTIQSQGYPLKPFSWTVIKNFGLVRLFPKSISRKLFPWADDQASAPMKTGWISGACMLISKTALKKVGGGLCEELYFYGEEVEWCWRANKVGMEVWCLPDVAVLHYGGGSTKKGVAPESIFLKNKKMESTLVLVEKTTGIPFNICMSLIIIAAFCLKFWLFVLNTTKRNIAFMGLKDELMFLKLQITHLFKN